MIVSILLSPWTFRLNPDPMKAHIEVDLIDKRSVLGREYRSEEI